MTMLKVLSAGLIATTMLTTVASGRENPMNGRHAVEHAYPGSSFPFADGSDGHPWMSGPAVGAYSAAPSVQPAGVCDHGDDPEIC
ncbi:hypothetical protein [Bradyrhizobium ganzhouense]|uniref:hypothetical protein n=1 Tax=Bradyrhizobium ganzhouense TaxID=1179767 RepID=UPI003CE95AF4